MWTAQVKCSAHTRCTRPCSLLASSSSLCLHPDLSPWTTYNPPQFIWTSSSATMTSTALSFPSTLQRLGLPALSVSSARFRPPNIQSSIRGPGSSMSLVFCAHSISHSVPQFRQRNSLSQFSAIRSFAQTYPLSKTSLSSGLSTPATSSSPVRRSYPRLFWTQFVFVFSTPKENECIIFPHPYSPIFECVSSNSPLEQGYSSCCSGRAAGASCAYVPLSTQKLHEHEWWWRRRRWRRR